MYKMRAVLLIFIVLFRLSLHSQTLEWKQKIGSGGPDLCGSMVVDDYYIYLTGGYSDIVNFNPNGLPNILSSVSQDNNDIFLAKYDHQSNLIWAFSIGSSEWDSAYDLKVDSLGNIFLFANAPFSDLDPSNSVFFLPVGSSNFVAKYNSEGSFLWARSIQQENIWATNVLMDEDINLYYSTNQGYNVLKINSNGLTIWEKNLFGKPVLLNDKLYSVSNFNTPNDFHNENSLFLKKFNLDGELLLDKNFASTEDGGIGGFISSEDNKNLFLSGDLWGKVEFYMLHDTVTIINYDSTMIGPNIYGPQKKEFFCKIDTLGNIEYVKMFTGKSPHPYLIKKALNGDVLLIGRSNFYTNFDPNSNFEIQTDYNHYIARYDSLFNYKSCSIFMGGSGNDKISSFDLRNNDTLFMSGHFFNEIDLDLTDNNSFLQVSPPEDIFFAKYSNFNILTNLLYQEEKSTQDKISIYPNLVTDHLLFNFNDIQGVKSIELISATGNLIKKINVFESVYTIETKELPSGIYFVNILVDNRLINYKVVKL